MKLEEYKEMRNTLVTEAEGLINEGKFEESTAKQAEIVALDNKFDTAQKELANLNALKEQEPVVLENKSIVKEDLTIMENKFETGATLSQEKLMENAFAKAVMGKELSATEMQNITYAEDNQVQIPTTTMNEIIGLVGEQYPFFGDVRKLQIKGNVSLNKHKAIKSGDAKAYKEKEATEVEENDFVKITLAGVEVAKLIEVSFKIENMSIEAFMTYLKQELVDRIGKLVGEMVFTGVRANGEFEGVIKVLNDAQQTVKYTKGADITFKDVTSAMAKVKSAHATGAAIYVSNETLWTQLVNIVDGVGRPLFVSDVTSGGVGRMFGRVVKVDGGVPEGVVVIANAAKGYAVNTNKGLSVETDKDLKNRTTQFLGHAIMDGAVTDETAMVAIIPEP